MPRQRSSSSVSQKEIMQKWKDIHNKNYYRRDTSTEFEYQSFLDSELEKWVKDKTNTKPLNHIKELAKSMCALLQKNIHKVVSVAKTQEIISGMINKTILVQLVPVDCLID